MSVGIYSLDGNTLLCKRENVATVATGDFSGAWDGGSITLSGGYYNIAACSTATGTRPYIYGVVATSILWAILNAHSVAIGYAANTATAGTFPATLGAITSVTSQLLPLLLLKGTA